MQDHRIITSLNSLVPVIPLSVPSTPGNTLGRYPLAQNHIRPVDHNNENLASFQPRTISALRAGIFRSPQTLAGLRCDAADRYLRWREVEHAYEGKLASEQRVSDKEASGWNKAEWEASISEDYARHLSALARSQGDMNEDWEARDPCYTPALDPLSVRSLVSALLSRTKRNSVRERRPGGRRWAFWTWGVALASVFCAGVGIGIALSSSS